MGTIISRVLEVGSVGYGKDAGSVGFCTYKKGFRLCGSQFTEDFSTGEVGGKEEEERKKNSEWLRGHPDARRGPLG